MKLFILFLCLTSGFCAKHYHENELWGKPCADDNSIPSPLKSAEEVVRYANWTVEQLRSYKDEFIRKLEKHHKTFDGLVQDSVHNKQEWLRSFYWFADEILPADKLVGQSISNFSIENTKAKLKFKTVAMTKINAGLKFILGTIDKITKLPENKDRIKIDSDFRRPIKESMRLIRSTACSMGNYMKRYKLQIQILLDDFLPKNISYGEYGLILRDTINYFEYITQLFEVIRVDEDIKTGLPRENKYWSNPCDYSPPPQYYRNKTSDQSGWIPDREKAKKLAPKIVLQASKTFADGLRFKEEYATELCNYTSFKQALELTRDSEWLRKVSWYQEEVLPKNKNILAESDLHYIIKHLMLVFHDVAPLIHKGAKKILSGLDRVLLLEIRNKKSLAELKPKVEAYFTEVKRLLCYFSDFLKASGHEQLWLFTETRISHRWVFPIFRDSLNYLEYISQVFEYIATHHALGYDPYGPQ